MTTQIGRGSHAWLLDILPHFCHNQSIVNGKGKSQMRTPLLAILVASSLVTPAFAHFDCGRHQCRLSGITHCGPLALALEWAHKFPHTFAHPGAVVVQRRRGRALGGGPGGHVSRIVEMKGTCRAIVNDEKGTYERDICRSLVAYVEP